MKTIWLYGPSGAGKTTIGKAIIKQLQKRGRQAVLVDGDELRNTICADLSFSYDDRMKQATRAAYMAYAINEGGAWCVVSLITPFKEFREKAKEIINDYAQDKMKMIFLNTSREERIKRDPKGLYAKAAAGELSAPLTGFDGPFDAPEDGGMAVDTDGQDPEQLAIDILEDIMDETYWSGGGI